jgi:hypothetical protein
MRNMVLVLGKVAVPLFFGVVLASCSRDPRLVGRWELVNATNAPLIVANEIEFFSNGTGRIIMGEGLLRLTETFTWTARNRRLNMESSIFGLTLMQTLDYELSGSTLTFFYDRATNSHSVYRRVR